MSKNKKFPFPEIIVNTLKKGKAYKGRYGVINPVKFSNFDGSKYKKL